MTSKVVLPDLAGKGMASSLLESGLVGANASKKGVLHCGIVNRLTPNVCWVVDYLRGKGGQTH